MEDGAQAKVSAGMRDEVRLGRVYERRRIARKMLHEMGSRGGRGVGGRLHAT